MENAANAVSKLFSNHSSTNNGDCDESSNSYSNSKANANANANSSGQTNYSASAGNGGDVDQSVDSKVAPAVEHKHIRKQHETREETYVNKERHQDHYHTTVQPVRDTEVLAEKHDNTHETKNRNINHDDGAARARAEADRAKFQNTSDQKEFESKTRTQKQGEEHVHHHLHETIQPVIERDVIDPSITHKRIDVNEKIQEPSQYHSTTTNSSISAEEFERKLNGNKSNGENFAKANGEYFTQEAGGAQGKASAGKEERGQGKEGGSKKEGGKKKDAGKERDVDGGQGSMWEKEKANWQKASGALAT